MSGLFLFAETTEVLLQEDDLPGLGLTVALEANKVDPRYDRDATSVPAVPRFEVLADRFRLVNKFLDRPTPNVIDAKINNTSTRNRVDNRCRRIEWIRIRIYNESMPVRRAENSRRYWRELRKEDVVFPSARNRPTAKVHGALEIPRDGNVARGIGRDTPGALGLPVAKALAPEMVPRGVELGKEDVVIPSACKHPAAKVHGALETSRDDDAARGIGGDTVAVLRLRIAKAIAPEVISRGAELRQEDVVAPGARKHSAAKVHGALEISRDDDVPRVVGRNTLAVLRSRIAKSLAPEVIPRGVELRKEDVVTPGFRKHPAAKVHAALESSRDDDVARGVGRDTVAVLFFPIAKAVAPKMEGRLRVERHIKKSYDKDG